MAEEARSPDEAVRCAAQHGPLDRKENQLSEKRSYRKRTAKEKAEIVLAGLWGDTSVRDVCREHEISEALY